MIKNIANLLRENKILFFILGLSMIMNMVGLKWGLPVNWHPDNKVKHVIYFLNTSDLNPHLFINPSFLIYCLYAVAKIFLFFKAAASYPGILILSRIFMALLGASSVFILYLLSKNIFEKRTALYSALFLALSAGNVIYSHFTIPAAMVTFLLMSALYTVIRYINGKESKYLYYSGIILGLAVSTKYTAILGFIFILFALLFVSKEKSDIGRDGKEPLNALLLTRVLSITSVLIGILLFTFIFLIKNGEAVISVERFLDSARNVDYWNEHKPEYIPLFIEQIKKLSILTGIFFLVLVPIGMYIQSVRNIFTKIFIRKELAIVILLSAVFFLIGTPFSILDYRQFLHDLFLNWQLQRYCLDFTYSGTQFISYFKHIVHLVGLPIFICSLLGMWYAVWHKDIKKKSIIILFSYIGLTYIVYGSRSPSIQRYIFPIVPAMLIFSGALFGKYLGEEKRVRGFLKTLFLISVIAYSFLYSFSVDLLLLNDSRNQASRWIDNNIEKNSSIAVFSYGRYLPHFKEGYKVYRISAIHDKNIDFDGFLSQFRYRRFDYIVLSEFFYASYINSDQYPKRKLFYEELMGEKLGYKRIADFKYRAVLTPNVDFTNPRIIVLANALK